MGRIANRFEDGHSGNMTMVGAETKEQLFETPDLNLAAFLYCRNFNFVNFDRQSGGRTTFVFSDSPELRHAIVDYANDGVVPVRTFCNTLRDLKAVTR